MFELKEEIYEFLELFCIGMDLAHDYKFKRYVLQNSSSVFSFHISILLGRDTYRGEDRFSGLVIVTIHSDKIVVNILDKINHYKGHQYKTFTVTSLEEFQNVIIEHMEESLFPVLSKIQSAM